jgi:uncharacterized protein YndB with AHSA1/START domain
MKRATIEAEVDIDRSPTDVFDYCSDHGHEPEWNPNMNRIEKITDGPVGIGTRYTTHFVKGPPMVLECVQYERPTRWSLIGTSAAMKAVGEGSIEPTAEGTHLLMRMEIDPRGLLKLALPFLRHRLHSDFERDVRKIKVVLEGEEARSRRSAPIE